MPETPDVLIHQDDADTIDRRMGAHWGARYQILTPGMRPRGGTLGVNRMVVPPGHAAVPFHWHAREDEVFYVLSGRGVLRYGEQVREVRAGHCISCPAGTQTAHQLANPFTEDLVYLAIGTADPHEVCGYPDTGKVMVRHIQTVGRLEGTAYMDGEPDVPAILGMVDQAEQGGDS